MVFGAGEMQNTVADQFIDTLAAAGVKRIYGIVGDSLNGLTDAVRRHGGMRPVHPEGVSHGSTGGVSLVTSGELLARID